MKQLWKTFVKESKHLLLLCLRNQVAFSHQIYEMTGQTNRSGYYEWKYTLNAAPNATKTLRAKKGFKKRNEMIADEKQKAYIIN